MVNPGQLSLAVTVKLTGPVVFPIGHEDAPVEMMLAGQVIVGGCVSLTVMVNMQLAELAEASDTLQVIVVVPLGKNEPEAGEHTAVPGLGQLSVTVGGG